MLKDEENYVLHLLRYSFGEEPLPDLPVGIDAYDIILAIRRNGVLLSVYQSLSSLPEVRDAVAAEYYAAVAQAVNQDHEGKRILQALNDAGLQCIALKGWEMRSFYPQPMMRQMADLDVLIQPYNYAQVRSTVESLGFVTTSKDESSWMHDNFHKGVVTLEAHKRLSDDAGAGRGWEKVMWARSEVVDGNIHRMAIEDFYIFHFEHMHKDLLDGSLGLRRIVDVWLLDQRLEEMDVVYIDKWLDALGLAEFRQRMCNLARSMMGESPIDEDSELLLRHAFECGIYGNGQSYKAGRIARMSSSGLGLGKLRSAMAAVFLPYPRMLAHFPELENRPWLLPLFWGKRIVRFLHDGGLTKYKHMLDYSNVSQEEYDEMRAVLKAAGISDR